MPPNQFPHFLENIVKLSNFPEAEPNFADLPQPNGRGGGRMDREGFPERARQEILQIKILYSKPHPKPGR